MKYSINVQYATATFQHPVFIIVNTPTETIEEIGAKTLHAGLMRAVKAIENEEAK